MSVDLSSYGREVEAGLPNERAHLDAALERQNFFDYEGARWESRFKRDAESSFDYQGRPHRPSGFLRQCVETLCEHLYCPGPSRRWSEAPGDEFLQKVYADNLVDALLQESDVLATLNCHAAIQIGAGQGDFTAKPITYRLWGREQIAAWTGPDDATEPVAVCTRDQADLRTRYRLWSDTEVWTYTTRRADETAGGRVAYLQSRETHDYGCLPFQFIHYRLPLRGFEVSCAGEFLHQAELRIDCRLNDLDESVRKHLNPVPVAEGVPSDWKPVVEPMRFIRMPLAAPRIGASGGYEPGEFARLYFLQPQVDVAGAWSDLTSYMNQAFRAARVPIAATLVDEQPGVVSGIALILAEAPLFKRARVRQGTYQVYELALARRTLTCAGNHYGVPSLVDAARTGRMALGWPQPSIPVPTADSLELLTAEVSGGLKSHLMAVQQWYGTTREHALELVRQIKADTEELQAIYPAIAAESPEREQAPEPGATPGPRGTGTVRMAGELDDGDNGADGS